MLRRSIRFIEAAKITAGPSCQPRALHVTALNLALVPPSPMPKGQPGDYLHNSTEQ